MLARRFGRVLVWATVGGSCARPEAEPRVAGPTVDEAVEHETRRVDPPHEPTPSDDVASSNVPLNDADIDWEAHPIMKTLGRISETMTHTEYLRAPPRVDEQRGVYAFDCSGMVEWVLRKATPSAGRYCTEGLGHRPLASDFYRRIAGLPAAEHRGWRRVPRVEEAEPGDVIAWIKPRIVPSPNTGHVAFIVRKPVRVPSRDDAFLVRVADSTSLLHEDDTRVGRHGFGLGTILVLIDPVTGAPTGYGWVGLRAWTFETPIAIGRPMR
jgi:hypothetical protein